MYLAVVSKRCPDVARKRLLSLPEISEVIKLPPDGMIAPPIADHPDSLICIYADVLYTHEGYAKKAFGELSYICKKCALSLCTDNSERTMVYPHDCGFNALCLDDRQILVGQRKSLAQPLKSLCSADTRQGYASCCSLYAGGTVITADPSIEKTCKALGVPVHKISGRDISLPGYREGFIGGAGGAFDNTVCLFGSPDHSESAREVLEFCQENGLSLRSLEDGPLTDRGGVKFVKIKNAK